MDQCAQRQPAERFINTHINPGSFSLDLFPQLVVTPRSLLSELPFDKLISLRKQRPACVHSTGAKRTRSPVTEVRVIQTSALQDTAYLPPPHSVPTGLQGEERQTHAGTDHLSERFMSEHNRRLQPDRDSCVFCFEEKTDWCVPDDGD